jgi:hypothetical protein
MSFQNGNGRFSVSDFVRKQTLLMTSQEQDRTLPCLKLQGGGRVSSFRGRIDAQGLVEQVVAEFARKARSGGLRMVMLATFAAGLSGCGGTFNNLPNVDVDNHLVQTPLGSLQGKVNGGQSPIFQSHIYLMKASHSGYGAPSISLLNAASNTIADTTAVGTSSNPAYYVASDSAGNFNITGDYSCTYNATNPEQSDLLYLLGLGGQTNFSFNGVGTLVPGTNNPYIGEIAVLGQCPSNGTFAGHLSYIIMNEVSTVAAAYALAQFSNGALAVGSPSAQQAEIGLTNAFANANILYDIQGTTALHEARKTPPGASGSVPYMLVNTLANIVANCINTSNSAGGIGFGTTAPSNTTCKSLWSNTGSTTTDTASAMMYVAQHPTKNVSTLFGLQGSSYEFVDRLATAPNDLTVAVNFTGSAFSNAVDVAVDSNGNPWVTNSDGLLSKMTPGGLISSFNIPGASYVALDTNNHAWVTSNTSNGPVYELNNAGAQVFSYSGQLYGDLNYPMGIALDGKGNVYVANSGGGQNLLNALLGNVPGDIVRISGSGTGSSFGSYFQGALTQLANTIPAVSQVAVDSTGNMWLSGDTAACVLLIFCAGENVQAVSGSAGFTNLNVLTPVTNLVSSLLSTQVGSISCFLFCSITEQTNGLAIDGANNSWVAVSGTTDKLVSISSNGVQSSGITGGGINNPQGVAIDGSGNVFVANTGNSSISEYASQGVKGFISGSNGILSATNSASSPASMLNKPSNLDIDQAGNVWVVNSASNNGSVTEFIGLAAPAVRPLAKAASTSMLATRPQ